MKIPKNLIIFIGVFLLSFNIQAQNIDRNLLENHVNILASDQLLGRGFGTEQGKQAADYIRLQFIGAGIEAFVDDYFHRFNERIGVINVEGQNVIGIVRGSDPELSGEYIVLGAHYDHVGWKLKDGDTIVYNGADDNASGVAGIIELGRYLVSQKEKLKRSIILIAFDGEESGLRGSERLLKDGIVPSNKIKAMFSLDMIGMYSAHKGLELEGIKLIKNYESLLKKSKSESEIILTKITSDLVPNTDTRPFGKRGIPAIHAFTGLESPYHQPEDTAAGLDFEGMATVCNFLANLSVNMSRADEIISGFSEPGVESDRNEMKILNFGLKTNIGSSYFNYPSDYLRSTPVFAAGLGAFLETRITPLISLQPEVVFEREGGYLDQSKISLYSLSIPVNLVLSTPDNTGMGVRAFGKVGGFYTHSFGGKSGSQDIDFGIYEEMQYGFTTGGGFQIMNFRLAFTYKESMVDFTRDRNMRLRTSYVTMGWVF